MPCCTLRLARELLDDHRLVKLEVLGDQNAVARTSCETPAPPKSGEGRFRRDGSTPATTRIIARQLERSAAGNHAAGQPDRLRRHGHLNKWNLLLILRKSQVPVLVDAGMGTASMPPSPWSWAATAC